MKYLLPKELGGAEREPFIDGAGTMAAQFRGDGWQLFVDRAALTPVAPPIPEEPGPGAYQIGEVTVFKPRNDESVIPWYVPDMTATTDEDWYSWDGLWKKFGGPDVTIQRLTPEPPRVELPWWGSNVGGIREMVGVEVDHGEIAVKVDGTPAWVGKATAREMAAALWTAAGGSS